MAPNNVLRSDLNCLAYLLLQPDITVLSLGVIIWCMDGKIHAKMKGSAATKGKKETLKGLEDMSRNGCPLRTQDYISTFKKGFSF